MTLLRWSCLLYGEKRGDQRSKKDRRRTERERKRDHWSATAHAVKRAIKRDAARVRPRRSPNLGCRSCRRTSQRDCGYQPQVRDIIDCSLILFFLPFSLPRQRMPGRSVNQVENPQELVLNSQWSLGKARSGFASDLLSIKTLLWHTLLQYMCRKLLSRDRSICLKRNLWYWLLISGATLIEVLLAANVRKFTSFII